MLLDVDVPDVLPFRRVLPATVRHALVVQPNDPQTRWSRSDARRDLSVIGARKILNPSQTKISHPVSSSFGFNS